MRERRNRLEWPCWFYAPNGDSAIFQCLADVPSGWHRQPEVPHVASAPLQVDKEGTIKQLQDKGIKIDPRWGAAQLKKVLDEND